MNIRNFDLNLLVVFNDLINTHSVSQTAVNLGLSQPAVSHALKRLREGLEDDLFIRTGREYSPTPKAVELSGFVGKYLADLDDVLFKKTDWGPRTSSQNFNLSGTAFDSSSWFPNLMMALKVDAPKVKMTFRGIIYEEFLDRMVKGKIDLSFAGNLGAINNFTVETLGENQFSLIACKSSTKFQKKISLKKYLEAEHILYTPTEKPGSDVDSYLKTLGHTRKIMIKTSYLNSIPELVSKRDYISIVPTYFAKRVVKHYSLKELEIPFQVPVFRHQMVWHKSKDNSVSHEWLRSYIRSNYKKLII
ncbi:MAG: DNA-binding transcriptional LysR family regulator [Bacteriovoracaceae bacterium]|jgi:DNA-binding transcriptional LysR family regulator